MPTPDATKTVRIKTTQHVLVTAVADQERRPKATQLEILIEAGAIALGHADLVTKHVEG